MVYIRRRDGAGGGGGGINAGNIQFQFLQGKYKLLWDSSLAAVGLNMQEKNKKQISFKNKTGRTEDG